MVPPVTNPDYTNYVMPARQACAWDATAKSPVTLVFFIALLLVILVSMAVFRSPGSGADAGCDLKASALQGQCRHQPHGSAGGVLCWCWAWVFGHLCRPQLPDELYRLFRRHCRPSCWRRWWCSC